MQFGRTTDLTRVDFAPAPWTQRSLALLASARGRAPALPQGAEWLRLGAPAFRHRGWLGTLYPLDAPADQWLSIYADKLSALELNSTFYGLPSEATLERWIAQTPPRFRFCPKVPRSISHELESPELPARVAVFTTHMARLGGRLGPALFQLPERATPAVLPQLSAALAAFPEGFGLALEVRHPDWFSDGALHAALSELLEQRGFASVITDVAGRRDVCHGSLTRPIAFVRFVGEGGHPSDEPRAAAWIDRLLALQALGLSEAYFFAHQPDDIAAPQLLAAVAAHALARGIELPALPLEQSARDAQLELF
jgi:uncharacterized protein YecE (DUF72 family)